MLDYDNIAKNIKEEILRKITEALKWFGIWCCDVSFTW